ncbi:hypothetical protein B0F88_12118 [Methylobacter tundripaludum]|uniref:Uncharacterized protein n=1 Tax=Methylobacter tundripaludum TaxID=173365 RepID=A0A2S6GJF8_9GAMM|nr:hypothetical protein B0F88_12118 [Methylobacter tundripaludum]
MAIKPFAASLSNMHALTSRAIAQVAQVILMACMLFSASTQLYYLLYCKHFEMRRSQ